MRRRHANRIFAGILLRALLPPRPLWAADATWKKARYEGGTVGASVNRFDWNTTVIASSDAVKLVFGGRKTVTFLASDITNLSYGRKAYRRVADMATLSVFLTPVALFGVLHKSKDHLIGIEWKTTATKQAAVLLMVHKDSYEELLLKLKEMTGKPVENWH
jgi:hypothetical protein